MKGGRCLCRNCHRPAAGLPGLSKGLLLNRKTIIVAVLAAALGAAALAPAAGATICGSGTYAYAGLGSRGAVLGVSATITPSAPLGVRDGHVAGWVGVTSPDAAGGNGGWLQVGLSAFPGDSSSRLYYEATVPGRPTVYRELATAVPFGQAHRFAVTEVAGLPGWWQASVDGAPAGPAIYMPGSDRRWSAQAAGESWAGSSSGACNDYGYSFDSFAVQSARTGRWAPAASVDLFQDPGYVVVRSSSSSFVASSAPARR